MKWIKYKVNNHVNVGTEENPVMKDSFINLRVPYDESVLNAIQRDAYNGEYEIFDDGQSETYQPTDSERLAALEAAMLEMMGVNVDG